MRRRDFLNVTATATVLTAVAGCVQTGEGTTPADNETATQTDNDGRTTTTTTSEPPVTDTPTDTTSTVGGTSWDRDGVTDGVEFSFTSEYPDCGQGEDSADVSFHEEAGEVLVDGVISGSDTCKRGTLASVDYDESARELTVVVDTTEREDCEDGVGATCLVDIPYRATFGFEDGLPETVTVSHGDDFGVTATHDSASASSPEE